MMNSKLGVTAPHQFCHRFAAPVRYPCQASVRCTGPCPRDCWSVSVGRLTRPRWTSCAPLGCSAHHATPPRSSHCRPSSPTTALHSCLSAATPDTSSPDTAPRYLSLSLENCAMSLIRASTNPAWPISTRFPGCMFYRAGLLSPEIVLVQFPQAPPTFSFSLQLPGRVAKPRDHSDPVYPKTSLHTVYYKNRLTCKNYIANYKIFQQHQLNSKRFPVFPGTTSNSRRFLGVTSILLYGCTRQMHFLCQTVNGI